MEVSLSEFVDGLDVREPVEAGAVAVYPLFNRGEKGPPYTLLVDALSRDAVKVLPAYSSKKGQLMVWVSACLSSSVKAQNYSRIFA